MCVFQDGTTVSRNGEVERGESRSPVSQQTPSSQGDTSNDELSTNSNAVGTMTYHISECVNHVCVFIIEFRI